MTALLLATLLFAQEENRGIEMMVNRMKEQLKLTDEQAAKVKEVLIQAEKERNDKVKALLSEEQQKAFDEMQRNPFGGGGRGERRGGMLGGFSADQLKEPLGLTDEQMPKIKEVIDTWSADLQKKMREPGFDWRNGWQALLTELGDKIKEHLTPEQKEKFDKWAEERTRGFNFGGQGRDRGGRPTPEERAKRVMETLKSEDAELTALVLAVLKAREASEDYDREYRDKIRELSRSTELSEEALEQRLTELRDQRRKLDKELSSARVALAEKVTFKQEVSLVEMNVLK